MITIPVYELLLLPEVTFFFKKDMFPEGRIKEQNIGEEILFVLQKKEIAPEEISMENIFPVGVMGIIENIDEEGSVKITTRKRVQVTHVEYTDGMVQAEAVDLPDIQDISPEEEKEKFDKIKKELMGRLGTQHDLPLEKLSGSRQCPGWLHEPFLGRKIPYDRGGFQERTHASDGRGCL